VNVWYKHRQSYRLVLIREAKLNHDINTQKLESLRSKNVKEYWKLLKRLSSRNNVNNVSSKEFANYFKSINNPDSIFFQPDEDVIYFNERYLKGEFQIMFRELDEPNSDSEIKACKELRNDRAGGTDFYINEFFKYGISSFILYLQTFLMSY
jgi:hypothetical protein